MYFSNRCNNYTMKNLISMTDFLPEDPYSKFLKQPLEIWMFVSCDEMEKAKERCLFEGFIIYSENDFYFSIYRCLDGFTTLIDKKNNDKTIESLVKYNLQLTPTAIKQIGL